MGDTIPVVERQPLKPAVVQNNILKPFVGLCDRCRELDLASYVKRRTKKGRGTIAFIEKASLKKSCELCTQYGYIFTALKTVRARVSNHDSFTLDFRQIQVGEWSGIYFRVRFMEFNRVLDFDFDFYPATAFIQTESPAKPPVTLTRTLKAASSDFDLVRQWLNTCQSSHDSCSHPHTRSDSLRVIDCREKRLCVIGEQEPYACLSYVWGTQSTSQQKGLTETLKNIPRTITDAMLVTLEMGIQYLWVDRYCIDQSNLDEKHIIIRDMGQIYQGAEVTIVASAGLDPHYGLPGVHNTPRRHQLYLSFGTHTFVSTENIREQINTSTWNSRGWTYQEMLLSRRRLVFTDSQMYFQCGDAVYLEGFNTAATASHSPLYARFRVFPVFEESAIMDCQARVTEYFQRHLSVNADIIHAFSGICNASVMVKGSATLVHFYGIPIIRNHFSNPKNHLAEFIQALTWTVMHRGYPSEPLTFPLAFPSWSWASVKTQYEGSEAVGEYMKPRRFISSRSNLQVRILPKDSYPLDIGLFLYEGSRLDYTHFEPNLHVTGNILEGPFNQIASVHAKYGSFQFDSRNDQDLTNVTALFLGTENTTSILTYSHSSLTSYRIYCLLLEPLTVEHTLTLPVRVPHYVDHSASQQDENAHYQALPEGEQRDLLYYMRRQRCFRRLGLWTWNMPGSTKFLNIEDDATSESIRSYVLDSLPGVQGTWTWSREAFDFF